MSSFFKKLYGLLFPKLCIYCGDEPTDDEEFICKNCLSELTKEQNLLCNTCASTVTMCSCRLPKEISHMKCSLWYVGLAAKLVRTLKTKNYKDAEEYVAIRLSRLIENDEAMRNADFITYVPRSRRSRREVGFYAVEEIAKLVSEKTGIRLVPFILRNKGGKPQKTLSENERIRNIRGKFRINKDVDVPFGNIILIDDVITTGATANECAKVLKKSGAISVYGLFFAKSGAQKST